MPDRQRIAELTAENDLLRARLDEMDCLLTEAQVENRRLGSIERRWDAVVATERLAREMRGL